MIQGSCCCGAVQFELTEAPGMLGMCHCSRCRKVGASALAFVKAEQFRLVAGQDKITTFKAVPPYQYNRTFCSVCGTALGEVLSDLPSFPINAHCIDSDLPLENAFHEFVSEKPCWFVIGDGAKQFSEHPQA
ncbi:GFA family protein [Alcanivorax jadensis]|uniref:GFA family protein n=1 Tax=Alcanivorax jadensis TaxID=64988 RepID=UPI003562D9EC